MTEPIRIQLQRTRGWRMPANTVNVARGPGRKWGNPWIIGKTYYKDTDGTSGPVECAETAVRLFEEMLQLERCNYPSNDEIRAELRGKNLACWCKPGQPCHADVLLRIANEEP